MEENLIDQVLNEILGKKNNSSNTKTIQAPLSTSSSNDVNAGLFRPNYQREKAKNRIGSSWENIVANKVNISNNNTRISNIEISNISPNTESMIKDLFCTKSTKGNELHKLTIPSFPPYSGSNKQTVSNNATSKVLTYEFSPLRQANTFARNNTFGFVIPNIEASLRSQMGIPDSLCSIGVISSLDNAAISVLAVDEGIKMTDSRIVSIDISQGSLAGMSSGSYIVIASKDVANVTKAVEITLDAIELYSKDIHQFEQGQVGAFYTARASFALNEAFSAPLDQAFAILTASPAALGIMMADTALKTANVNIVKFLGPSAQLAFANQVWLMITGEASPVKNALEAGRDAGIAAIKKGGGIIG